jgi:TPR repeat protein
MNARRQISRKWLMAAAGVGVCVAGLLAWVEWGWVPNPPATSAPPPAPPVDLQAIRTKAEAGDARAQAQLGRLCEEQQDLANQYAEAAKWFGRAAEQGNADAQAGLAELYEVGRGVPKDPAKAIELYRLAAGQGHAGAQYALGYDYEKGRGVPQDQDQAAKWFRLAAEQAHSLAQYDLGQRYVLGVGVSVDCIEALKWYTLAAAQGQADAAQRRDTLKNTMTSSDIAEANRRVAALSHAH